MSAFATILENYRQLLEPSEALMADLQQLEGDILVIGAGGKMGPALARLAVQATQKSGVSRTVMAASRFSEPGLQQSLDELGVRTLVADLLNDDQLAALPDAANVLYLAGTKFGTSGNEPLTWAMNSYLPGRVAEKYRHARIVVFSTGNVYPLLPVASGGATEGQAPAPVGEYAQSCLGRERVFEYFSARHKTPLLIYRLNYANDVTYGVLVDVAMAVREGAAIDLRMGHVNVIWQGDANEMALRSLLHCRAPREVLNITGPDIVPVRVIAMEFGRIFRKKPRFVYDEEETALLSDASKAFALFGRPRVMLKTMINMIADWIAAGGEIVNKPTHFQEREGRF